MVTVAQIGLGRWGLQRAWTWRDTGVNLKVFDVAPPPEMRLPPGSKLCKTLKEVLEGADIVSLSVPPSEVISLVDNLGDRLVLIEKPGASNYEEAMKVLDKVPNLVIGFTTLYDNGLQSATEDFFNIENYFLKSARLHQASLHNKITVVEDLTVHDLALCDKLGVLNSSVITSVSGNSPYEIHIELEAHKNIHISIDSCVRHPGRVRLIQLIHPLTNWLIIPDEFALKNTGLSIPPAQARPIYKECDLILKKLNDTNVKTEGERLRHCNVWRAIKRIREQW